MFCTGVRPIGTALPVRRTVIGRQCNSVETAQPGDRTTNLDIMMPECCPSSQRVDSLARVIITPVRHTHTRLQTAKMNLFPTKKAQSTNTNDSSSDLNDTSSDENEPIPFVESDSDLEQPELVEGDFG